MGARPQAVEHRSRSFLDLVALDLLADRDDPTDSFLALVDEAFRRLLDELDAHLHVTGFAEGYVAFVLTRDGLEVRRRAEVYGSEN